MDQPDYGTGQKKLSIYLFGVASCVILTVIAFGMVMAKQFTRMEIFTVIYSAAIVQFFVQVICFLRLNTQTPRAKVNVLSIVLTMVILLTIVVGTVWIMWNLNYYMMH